VTNLLRLKNGRCPLKHCFKRKVNILLRDKNKAGNNDCGAGGINRACV